MWSYYGAKTNIVDRYPKPKHDKIIEPFAGSARYALKYFDRDVLLVDKYEVIVKIWKWLQQCSPNDILSLPRFFKTGESLDDYTFDCEEAKLFTGFMCACANPRPILKPTKRKTEDRPNFTNFGMKRVDENLFKIKHWEIQLGDYSEIENQEATWFIDPPYQFGGQAYVHSNKKINFTKLSEWCMSRSGQIIVCENTKATWMDFKPMIIQRGSLNTTTEAIWTNQPSAFDSQQITLI